MFSFGMSGKEEGGEKVRDGVYLGRKVGLKDGITILHEGWFICFCLLRSNFDCRLTHSPVATEALIVADQIRALSL